MSKKKRRLTDYSKLLTAFIGKNEAECVEFRVFNMKTTCFIKQKL